MICCSHPFEWRIEEIITLVKIKLNFEDRFNVFLLLIMLWNLHVQNELRGVEDRMKYLTRMLAKKNEEGDKEWRVDVFSLCYNSLIFVTNFILNIYPLSWLHVGRYFPIARYATITLIKPLTRSNFWPPRNSDMSVRLSWPSQWQCIFLRPRRPFVASVERSVQSYSGPTEIPRSTRPQCSEISDFRRVFLSLDTRSKNAFPADDQVY